jgi:WD40 repeat protein
MPASENGSGMVGVESALIDADSNNRGSNRLKGHSGGAKSLAYSGDGTRLASSGDSGEIKIWNLAMREGICSYREPKGEISALALSHDGRLVASAHEPKEITAARFGRGPFPAKNIPVDVRVWDSQTRSDRWILSGHPAGVYRVAFSPDGNLLASTDSLTVKIWKMSDGKLMREFPVYVSKNEPFSSVIGPNSGGSFSPKGDHLIVVASEAIQIWNLATGQPVALIQGHQSSGIRSFALSPDQTRLATSSVREVKLWDALTGQEVLTLPVPAADRNESNNSVGALAWSADGIRLRAGLLDGSIIEWDGATRTAK